MKIIGSASIEFEDGEVFKVIVTFRSVVGLPGILGSAECWSDTALIPAAKDCYATLRMGDHAIRVRIVEVRADGTVDLICYAL